MKLFVGINWDENLLERFDNLNQAYAPDRIEEVYGSMKSDPFGQVRESERLVEKSISDIESFVEKAHSKNIGVCYVINSPIITPKQISNRYREITDSLRRLEELGIDNYIVASPAFAKFLKDEGEEPSLHQLQPGIIGSTVFNLRTLEQMEEFRKIFDRVCPSTDRNRDIKFLEEANKITPIELLVNEMCLFQCPWRNYHYCQEAAGVFFTEDLLKPILKDFPINECWRCFVDNPANIVKSRWVRPEDIHLYEKVGIKWFKLSGRTMSSEWIFETVKAYILRKYEGNLLDLFPIAAGSLSKEKSRYRKFFIDNFAISGIGSYLSHLSQGDRNNCAFGCRENQCETCDIIMESWKKQGIFREL